MNYYKNQVQAGTYLENFFRNLYQENKIISVTELTYLYMSKGFPLKLLKNKLKIEIIKNKIKIVDDNIIPLIDNTERESEVS